MTRQAPQADALQTLLARWKQGKIGLASPVTARRVREAFTAAGGRATGDLVRMYGVVGGMDDCDEDGWTLQAPEVVARSDPATNRFGTVFSDYLHSSWFFRARPVSEDVSEIYLDLGNHRQAMLVATSLDAFLDALASDPRSVLLPPT